METVCPKCKGANFRRGKSGGLDYPHLKCNDCGTVVWVATKSHYSEHGWCGSPEQHWAEPDPPKTVIQQLQEKAKEKVKPSDIPF